MQLELAAPDVVWRPELGEGAGGSGVRDMVKRWLMSFLEVGVFVLVEVVLLLLLQPAWAEQAWPALLLAWAESAAGALCCERSRLRHALRMRGPR